MLILNSTQLAKTSIDPKFVDLTADVVGINLYSVQYSWCVLDTG